MQRDAKIIESLNKAAKAACANAHAPYSGFPVGAAVLDARGGIHAGCNVENASFGITSCAERNAIAAAVGSGAKQIRMVLVYTPGDRTYAPCGACRQVIFEFAAEDTRVLACCDIGGVVNWDLKELLPAGFRLDRNDSS